MRETELLALIIDTKGAALQDAEVYVKVADFTPVNQKIFLAIKQAVMLGAPVHINQIADLLEAGVDSRVSSALREVTRAVPDDDVHTIARHVARNGRRRLLGGIIRNAERALEAGESAAKVSKDLMDLTASIELENEDPYMTSGQVAGELLKKVREIWDGKQQNVAIPTPYGKLNEMCGGGILIGELNVVGARPMMGKTAFVEGLMKHASDIGYGVIIVNLDDSNESLAQRFIQRQTEISFSEFFSERSKKKEKAIMNSMAELCTQNVLYLRSGSNYTSIMTKLRQAIHHLPAGFPKVGLVVVDYIQLISGTAYHMDKVAEVGFVARGLRAFCKDIGAALLGVSQLSRDSEKQDREPTPADLRYSGALEQDALNIWFPYRNEDEAKVIIGKARRGTVGSVPMCWDGPRMKWTEKKATKLEYLFDMTT